MGVNVKICSFLLSVTFLGLCVQAQNNKVVCYFGGWTVYRPGNGRFEIEMIDPSLCTHAIYAFVGLENDATIKVLDPWQDLPDNWGKDGFGRFNKMKQMNPKLKTLISIGGFNEGSEKYSRIWRIPENRKIFVNDAVNFLKKYGFDGLDVVWQYPNQGGSAPQDVKTFPALLQELKTEFVKHGFLLSAGVASIEGVFSVSYNVPEISKHLDFINVMTYDFHGAWESRTGFNSPLYMSKTENNSTSTWNVAGSINAWIKYGAPKEKLVVGIPTYGRSFTLQSTDCIKPGCSSKSPGRPGPLTGETGFLGFNEICLREKEAGSQLFWDDEVMVPYLVTGDQWVGFDNERSVENKVEFIKSNKLGGAMIWSFDTDDFMASCKKGMFPLITILKKNLIQ